MHAHRQRLTVTQDHEIKVSLPPDFPTGSAEVIVLSDTGADAASISQKQHADDLDAFFAFLQTVPPSGRSAQEIERQLREERDSWDR